MQVEVDFVDQNDAIDVCRVAIRRQARRFLTPDGTEVGNPRGGRAEAVRQIDSFNIIFFRNGKTDSRPRAGESDLQISVEHLLKSLLEEVQKRPRWQLSCQEELRPGKSA